MNIFHNDNSRHNKNKTNIRVQMYTQDILFGVRKK